jgi:putative transposase
MWRREILSPAKRKATVEKVVEVYGLSQRRACRALSVCRSSVKYKPIKRADEDEITAKVIELASNYGRYGYRRITMMLRAGGLLINHKRVERIWREQGLKVPKNNQRNVGFGSITEVVSDLMFFFSSNLPPAHHNQP